MPAPIAVFCYNRPEHLQRTLEGLAANDFAEQSHVFIYCDGLREGGDPVPVKQTRHVAHSAKGFLSVSVIERKENLGMKQNIPEGITEIIDRFGRVVIFEDDIWPHSSALRFLNAGLERYENTPAVFSISAWAPSRQCLQIPVDYPYNAYFFPRFHCWGWATWKTRWDMVDFTASEAIHDYALHPYLRRAYATGGGDVPEILDAQLAARINTWDIFVDLSRFRNGGLTLCPTASHTRNLGFDGSGVHYDTANTGAEARFNDPAPPSSELNLPAFVFVDPEISLSHREACSPTPPPPREHSGWTKCRNRFIQKLGLKKA